MRALIGNFYLNRNFLILKCTISIALRYHRNYFQVKIRERATAFNTGTILVCRRRDAIGRDRTANSRGEAPHSYEPDSPEEPAAAPDPIEENLWLLTGAHY
jgi:hypothetical protein